jgi:hypothetical protein
LASHRRKLRTETKIVSTRWLINVVTVALVGGLLAPDQGFGVTAAAPPPPSTAAVQSAYGQLPLSFEANQGQQDPSVRFITRGHGHTLFLTPSEVALALRTGEANEQGRERFIQVVYSAGHRFVGKS